MALVAPGNSGRLPTVAAILPQTTMEPLGVRLLEEMGGATVATTPLRLTGLWLHYIVSLNSVIICYHLQVYCHSGISGILNLHLCGKGRQR